jgi:hypothetical protein
MATTCIVDDLFHSDLAGLSGIARIAEKRHMFEDFQALRSRGVKVLEGEGFEHVEEFFA